jgi:hypothetical protein
LMGDGVGEREGTDFLSNQRLTRLLTLGEGVTRTPPSSRPPVGILQLSFGYTDQ